MSRNSTTRLLRVASDCPESPPPPPPAPSESEAAELAVRECKRRASGAVTQTIEKADAKRRRAAIACQREAK